MEVDVEAMEVLAEVTELQRHLLADRYCRLDGDLFTVHNSITICLSFAILLRSPGSPAGVQERAEASLHKRPPASLQLRPKTEVPQRPHQEVRQRPQTGTCKRC